MTLPSNGIPVLRQAFQRLLGKAAPGSVAYVRCLHPDIALALASDQNFALDAWKIAVVTDHADTASRRITADQAVEWREDKADPLLLLVNMDTAGAGMDGIYSAAREVTEDELFGACLKLAHERLPHGCKRFAEAARRKARHTSRNQSLSPWREFSYLCRAMAGQHVLGEALPEIGLWPVATDEVLEIDVLDRSARLVERLLPRVGNRQSPEARVVALRLPKSQTDEARRLARFLNDAESLSRLDALQRLEGEEDFWINRLRPGVFETQSLRGVEWLPWRGKTGKLLGWSGLIDNSDQRPELRLNSNVDDPNTRARLEVRWKTDPAQLAKGAVDYLVQIKSGTDVLAEKSVNHQQKNFQQCVFTQDDFEEFDENSRFEAQAVIRALAGDSGEDAHSPLRAESDDFILCFGEHPTVTKNSSGRVHPTLALAVVDIAPDEQAFQQIAGDIANPQTFSRDKKGFIACRHNGKTARVLCPNLLLGLASSWVEQGGALGRWRQRVRADGSTAEAPEFVPVATGVDPNGQRFVQASRAFMAWLAKSSFGPLAVLYSDQKPVVDYVNTATAWWESTGPDSALIHTLEVLGLSGQRHGLIVLPTHPLRVAWQQGFDLLAYRHRYEGGVPAAKVTKLLSGLSGAHYPAMLPGLDGSEPFVFADNLGFHAVAMTAADDPEPKATVALLSRLLAGGDFDDEESVAPTIGRSAADLLGGEIASYLTLHPDYRRVRLHALRPGDAKPAARALGKGLREVEEAEEAGDDPGEAARPEEHRRHAFELELYPADAGRRLCGQFLSTTAERRRSGAGFVPEDDRWLLESVRRPGGVTLPRLQWSRRAQAIPETPAHLALAFDLLSSRIECHKAVDLPNGSLEVHGLSLAPERRFEPAPVPHWLTVVPTAPEGDKHPAGRVLSERLVKASTAILRLVCRQRGGKEDEWPVLVTEVNADQEEILTRLHHLCDWVVSVDRHAGVEYFDSPRDLPRPYDAYLIDCVPERDDLGFLQLITSTSSLDEVRRLLEDTLGEMGLSASPANCKLLLDSLKALSGRLALRLTNAGNTVAEMVALALVQNHCVHAQESDERWISLREGFFVPLDDVPELLQSVGDKPGESAARADLLYVTVARKGSLRFSFVEVKFRRYLKTARSPDVLDGIEQQLQASEERWEKLYGQETTPLEKTVLRARLTRVLRFYLKKARRHTLRSEAYQRLSSELDRLARDSTHYELVPMADQPRARIGFVLCPEYKATMPIRIDRGNLAETWLFGPDALMPPPPRTDPLQQPDQASVAQSAEQTDEAAASSPVATKPPPEPVTPIPGTGDAHIVLGHETSSNEPISWRVSIKGNPHLLIVGLPGMGKTTCLIHICRQFIQAGIAPIVFSYHEDIDEKLGSALFGAIRTVSYAGLGFNPLQVVSTSPLAYVDNVAMLRDIFAAIFPDLGDVQLGRIREALKQSYADQGWTASSSGGIPAFRAFHDLLKADAKTDKKVLLRLNELADYGFFEATSGAASLLESPMPALVQIHATQNELLQRAFASFVLQNLYQAMFRRGTQERITHAVVFDEAHRAARLKLIPTMAKECRKFGLSLIVASQEVKDFDDSMFTAIASYLALRTSETDAKKMAKIFAPSDKVTLFTDRVKQTQKYRGWFSSEGLRTPIQVKLLA